MTYAIRIEGLTEVKRALGQDFKPTIKAATKAIAAEVQDVWAPYPPQTIANSPSNPRGYWYERGFGTRRWTTTPGANMSRAGILKATKTGGIKGYKTSQTMNRRWSIVAHGAIGWALGNAATYSKYLHSAAQQVRWAGPRGWITDKRAAEVVVQSGAIQHIIGQAIAKRLAGRLGGRVA